MANKAEKSQVQVQEQKNAQVAEVKSLYIKGENDKDFRTSDGFFKDPFTGKEFTGNEERLQLGTKTPRIKDSQGNAIPLAYKFWTKEEREAYKSGSGTKSSGSRSSTKSNELREKLLGLQKYLADNKKLDDKIEAMIAAMLPPDPAVEKAQKQVDNMTPEQKAMFLKLLKDAQ